MHFLRTAPSIRLPYSCDSRSAQGDTYDRVSETRKERGLQQRAQLLLELERQMSHKERTSELNFPRWLHFVRRQDAEDAEDEPQEEWGGRLRAVNDKLEENQKKLEAQVQGLKGDLKKLDEKNMAQVQGLKDQLKEILAFLQSSATTPTSSIATLSPSSSIASVRKLSRARKVSNHSMCHSSMESL